MFRPQLAKSLAYALTISIAFSGLPIQAADTVQSAAARELERRQQREVKGREEMQKGAEAMKRRDWASAYGHYENACKNIAPSDATQESREAAAEGVTVSAIRYAEQRITEGYYASAAEVLKRVAEEYNPGDKRVLAMIAQIEEPDYYNKTITPQHRKKVEDVKQMEVDAKGYEQSGRYDMALKRNEQILGKDKYNMAAWKHIEEIDRRRDDVAIAAYNATRGRAIWEVDKEWARPVRRFDAKAADIKEKSRTGTKDTAPITAKINSIKIPRLDLKDATIREAIEFLVQKSRTLDPEKEGVNIVLKLDSAGGSGGFSAPVTPPPPAEVGIPGLDAPTLETPDATMPAPSMSGGADTRITVNLNNVPLIEAIKYITNLANLRYKIEPFAISILPIGGVAEDMFIKEWSVPPDFIGRLPGGGGDAASGLSAPTGDPTLDGGSGIADRMSAKDYLAAAGVVFGNGAFAMYSTQSSTLIVKNTEEQLDVVERLVEIIGEGGIVKQVEIQSKFVEITQNNLKELSFDWLLGQANFPGISTQSLFVGGGTSGTSPALNPLDFPFLRGGSPVGQFPLSSGLRSGEHAISLNAVDALLFGTAGASAAAPGIFALTGVGTDPNFQVVMRALDQKKGVDLLSAPRVTTKSGSRATIEIIREFRYPTEFEPPQIPQSFGNNNGGGGIILGAGGLAGGLLGGQQDNSFPVTPTTPTAFETRNIGVTLEVEPQIASDNYTIDMTLAPQVVEFEGFINYGSPIQTSSTNALGQPVVNVITPNVINQPIFSTRKVTTNVSVYDGATVVLGGLVREDVQKVEDKTPLLGDVPLLGRLFRSNVDQHIKRNLVIFVNARLVTPEGVPLRGDDEEEEVVDALPMPSAPDVLPDISGFTK